jgi:hypothetical protein
LRYLYFVFAILSLLNGGWMLVYPESWYSDLPAAVPDTGPYNGHFIRDVGVVFVLIALGFGWCAWHPDRSLPVVIVIALFFVGHALVHAIDLVSGRLPHSHWKTDAPAVFLPAIILTLITIFLFRQRKST